MSTRIEVAESFVRKPYAVLTLRADTGVQGVALARMFKPGFQRSLEVITQQAIGLEVEHDEPLEHRLRRRCGPVVDRSMRAAAAWIELALLDLLGRSRRCTVAELIGPPYRREIPLYLSSSGRNLAPEQELEHIASRLDGTGIKAVKVKLGSGGQRGDDAEPFARRPERFIPMVRRELGDDITLYVDANGSYSAPRAREVARVLEAHSVGWFEEPCAVSDWRGLESVARSTSVAVAFGENVSGVEGLKEVLAAGWCQVVQPDLWRIGGLGAAARLAEEAMRSGRVTVLHHASGALGYLYSLHFAAAVRNSGEFQEYRHGLESTSHWFEPPMAINDGALSLPKGAGLGYDTAVDDILKEVRRSGHRTSLARLKGRIVAAWRGVDRALESRVRQG